MTACVTSIFLVMGLQLLLAGATIFYDDKAAINALGFIAQSKASVLTPYALPAFSTIGVG